MNLNIWQCSKKSGLDSASKVKAWTPRTFQLALTKHILTRWVGYRIVKIARTPDPTATAPFQTLVLLEFESGEGFDEAMTAPSSAGVLGDMPNFTDQTPTLLVGSEVTTWTA